MYDTSGSVSGLPLIDAKYHRSTRKVNSKIEAKTCMAGTSKSSPHDALCFYHHDQLEGVRAGKLEIRQSAWYTLEAGKRYL